jgi:signal transduction histidine kinase
MIDVFLIFEIIIAVALLSLAAVSLFKRGYKTPVNRLFAAFSILVTVWIIANNISNDVSQSSQVALYANYIVFPSSFGVAILLMQFIAKIATARKLEIFINRILFFLWTICLASAGPLVVAGVVEQGNVYAVTFGPLIGVYALGILIVIVLIIVGLIYGLRNSRGVQKRQLKTLTVGIGVALPLIVLLSFIWPSITGEFYVTEFGILPMIVVVISLYYSVARYKLFDIRLAAVRTATYVLSLLTLALLYYGTAYLFSSILFRTEVSSAVDFSPVNIILTIVLVFIFQPIKRFFDKITNFLFYRDVYNEVEFFARLSRKISTMTDLNHLLNFTSSEIATTLKASYGSFLIYRGDDKMTSVSTDKLRKLPISDARELDEYVHSHDGSVVIADMLVDPETRKIKRLLLSHKISLALPIMQNKSVLGYLFLGENLGSHYTLHDIRTLQTISDELTIAIQNALSIQAVKELNETLQQRIDSATKELRASNAQLHRLDEAKDDFISMASHQLRTPLTSIKGYISMLMEGDIGKITPEQAKVLNEAFMSSERMVRLISDFLNVSRMQTGKFIIEKHSVDLALLVQREIESLTPNAMARGMKFVYKMPKNLPNMQLDENKIQQVIMNFSDNALYYSKDNGQIIVSLKKIGDCVEFIVKDDGIGVPEAEQAHLFNKFFRATNARRARPDGTGVGLFLAKKVIDVHDGEIIFESKEGKGSSFGFRLPLPKNE